MTVFSTYVQNIKKNSVTKIIKMIKNREVNNRLTGWAFAHLVK